MSTWRHGFSRPFLETFVGLPEGCLRGGVSRTVRAMEAAHRIKVIVTEYDGIDKSTLKRTTRPPPGSSPSGTDVRMAPSLNWMSEPEDLGKTYHSLEDCLRLYLQLLSLSLF